MCASMAATSGEATSPHPYARRVSPATGWPPGGAGPLIRDRYGSIRIEVVPSVISQPAAPRYFRVTGLFFPVFGWFGAVGVTRTTIVNTQHASPNLTIGMHLQVDPAVECILSGATGSIKPIPAVMARTTVSQMNHPR